MSTTLAHNVNKQVRVIAEQARVTKGKIAFLVQNQVYADVYIAKLGKMFPRVAVSNEGPLNGGILLIARCHLRKPVKK